MRLLIVEDSPDDAELMLLQLKAEGFITHWQRVDTQAEFIRAIYPPPDLILSDWSLPQFSGMRALELMNEHGLDIPFIIVSGNIGEEAAFAAVRLGAYDYVLKGRMKRLGAAVRHALEQKTLKDQRAIAEETVRLQNQLLNAIREAQAQYIAGKDEHEVFQSLTNIMVSLTGSKMGRLDEYITQADGVKRLVPLAITGMDHLSLHQVAQRSLEPDILTNDLANLITPIRKTKIYHRPEQREDLPVSTVEHPGIQSYMGVPLYYGGELVGTAGLANRPGGYSDMLAEQFGLFMTTCAGIIAAFRKDRAEKAAQASLRESEEKFRQLAESIHEAFFLLDRLKLEMIYVSPAFELISGYTLADCSANPKIIWQAIHTEDIQQVQTAQSLLYNKNIPLHESFRIIRPDGEIRWVWARVFPVYDEQCLVVRYAGIIEDVTQRMMTEKSLHERTDALETLFTLSKALRTTMSIEEIFKVVMQEIQHTLAVDAGLILLIEPNPEFYKIVHASGLLAQNIGKCYSTDEGLWGAMENALQTRVTVHYSEESERNKKVLGCETLGPVAVVPLQSEVNVVGALMLGREESNSPHPFSASEVHLITAVGELAANAIRRVRLFNDLLDANNEAIEGWSQAMDLRDQETEFHSLRVTEMTLQLAKRLGFKDQDLIHVRRGALLHDMGKLGISDVVLLKRGKLDDQEWEEMRKHPTLAFELLSRIQFLRPALDIPYCHHERWDGSGYPQGLIGERIPLSARIFAVCDVWDALTNDRPYRKAWTRQEAFDYICEQVNKQFDPRVVDAFREEIIANQYLA